MEMQDLSKWVNEYNLKFKAEYGPKIGCVVSIFEAGKDRPRWVVHGRDLIEALGKANGALNKILL